LTNGKKIYYVVIVLKKSTTIKKSTDTICMYTY
jgi:hypothetical protein